jgi:spore coat protein U-like protein
MKKLNIIALASGLLIGLPLAAQTKPPATASVQVTATLTAGCTASTPAAISFNYTGLTTTAISTPAASSVTFSCTRGLAAPSIAWDSGATIGTATTGTSPTATGLVSGLQYTLTASSGTGNGGGAAAVVSSATAATATTYVYNIALAVPGGQAGDLTSGTPTSATRVMTLTY